MSALSDQLNQENLSLEEKLELIAQAMAAAQSTANEEAAARGGMVAPVDPQDMLMCEGCQ